MFISAIVHTLFSSEFPFNKSKFLACSSRPSSTHSSQASFPLIWKVSSVPLHFITKSLFTFCFQLCKVCSSFSNHTLSWNTHYTEQINKYKIFHKIWDTFCTGKRLQIKNLCIYSTYYLGTDVIFIMIMKFKFLYNISFEIFLPVLSHTLKREVF